MTATSQGATNRHRTRAGHPVTRQTWCLAALAAMAAAGCWHAGRTGEAVWSALFGLLGGGFLFAIGWTWHDEGMSE